MFQTNGFVIPISIAPIQPNGSFTLEAEGNGHGTGSGSVTNDFVNFVIDWPNGTRGAYNGSFDAQGVIHGSAFDIKNPDSFAGWHSSKSF